MSRTTFFSTECTFFLKGLLENSEDNQTPFTKNPILKNARTSEDSILNRYLENLGMNYKFDNAGYSLETF